MLKWFDTNYHYLVPEFYPDTKFSLSSNKIFEEFTEALSLGIRTKPVLIGPITFLHLGKAKVEFEKLSLLPQLIPIYASIIRKLSELGAEWIQIDEPVLVLELSQQESDAFQSFYAELKNLLSSTNTAKILIATYFDDIGTNLNLLASLPVEAVHVDITRGENQTTEVATAIKKSDKKILSLGVIR